jgi:photosystem II stability/assembly factor-like uncharacterized protein
MKRKNKYIILALFGLFSLENMQAQWVTEKCPSLNNLNSVHLINDHSGWIVGDKGTMLFKVINNWVNYQKITDENLYSVFMIGKNNGWVVGSKGTILHFDGEKWESFASPTREKLYSVSFKDSENGIAVGSNGTVVIYKNGTWELAKKATRGNLYAVSAKNDLSMIGGGLEGINIPIMKMLDNADKTLINYFDPFIEIKSITQTEQKNVWAVGRPGEIFHFDGSEWKKLELDGRLPSLNCVFFSDENNGISVGYSGAILTYSEKSWTKQNSPVKVKLNGATIAGNTYYAVGNNGTIVSCKQIPENSVAPASNNTATIKIETYPNPSADILNIIIPDEDGFNADLISITNVYGQVVSRKNLDPDKGGQVYQLNTSELNNGLYLVNITSAGGNGKTALGKFIVKH